VVRRGAAAGAVAATVWWAADPLFKRAFGTPYADSEFVGPFLTRGPLEPVANLVTHAGNGAGFGALFARLGLCGVRAGVGAALAENALLWPLIGVAERFHPKRRDGTWPPLARNPRAFASATAGHALFGAVLGLLTRD
jgi:hypothetical protein